MEATVRCDIIMPGLFPFHSESFYEPIGFPLEQNDLFFSIRKSIISFCVHRSLYSLNY
jgi:hypothetical protein